MRSCILRRRISSASPTCGLSRVVEVALADGKLQPAWTYIFRAELAARLGEGDWDFARFLREGKRRFVSGYAGFDSLRAG